MAAGPPYPHARHDRQIVVHELQHAGLGERHVIIQQVAGARPGARVDRVLPLAAPDDVLRAGKARANAARGVADGEPARVIEVEVGGDHDVDVFRGKPRLRQGVVEMPAALDAVDLARAEIELRLEVQP